MRAALVAHAPLVALLQGEHIYEELPHGAQASFVTFAEAETRDWSTKEAKAHEHFVTLAVRTNSRSRKLASDIAAEIEAALDNAPLALAGHRLVNLRLVFWSIARAKSGDGYAGTLRFRAATEAS
jgi:hypothetical protein